MKTSGLAFALIALVLPVVFAQVPPPSPAADPKAKTAPAAASATDPKAKAAPAAAAVKDKSKAKEDEKIPPIEGITVPRANGTFLGVQIVNNNWVVKFFDDKKKKMKPDAVRAIARWAVKYQPNEERTVLNVGADGESLTSAFTVRPPHPARVVFTLFASNAEDAAGEYITVEYHD